MPYTARHTHQRQRSRLSIGIAHYNSTIEEKLPWFIPVILPVPGASRRALRVWIVNPRRLRYALPRKQGVFAIFVTVLVFTWLVFGTPPVRSRPGKKTWTAPSWPQLSRRLVVYTDEDLRRIWLWEVMSGHYPSRRKLPKQLDLPADIKNPAIPALQHSRGDQNATESTYGVGANRIYLDMQRRPPDVAYPPRPVPGSAADFDIIMEHCDFTMEKYVRDCLEVLRVGGGLDNGKRVRRGNLKNWKYMYVENGAPAAFEQDILHFGPSPASPHWESLSLPALDQHRPYSTLNTQCDPDSPRIFHMYWGGPLTDKPYSALMSFLFTQNTGLHTKKYPSDRTASCRPQFWVWINAVPTSPMPPANAVHNMFEELKANPWASPFLHPRFKDVIKFKLWNTTELLDGIPELKDEWRQMSRLFKSGADVPDEKAVDTPAEARPKSGPDSYDKLSTILSDMARFVLTHTFGGIYLDADVIFLRDWEDLWGWQGAFAYRWSRKQKYNTAVLRMRKGSALGTFVFRTALNNKLVFHPMEVTKYMDQAYLQGLLYRLPDALFDPAWLSAEGYQKQRPPQPYFDSFTNFFITPASQSAAPQALGFQGFFSGAYGYHYHSPWPRPFDIARNFPDLGPRFKKGEKVARDALKVAAGLVPDDLAEDDEEEAEDEQDLDWSAVMKRTYEAYVRGDTPNMYGEWLEW